MLLWTVIIILTLIAVSVILLPVFSKKNLPIAPSSHDLNVYKNQLTEIDNDLERGTINPDEAKAAKVEISRRILAASAELENTPNESQRISKPLITFSIVLLIPISAIGIYLYSGSPEIPDMPLVTRMSLPTEQQDISLLVAKVEARLAENPQDGQGWEVIAPVYLRLEQPEKAIIAYNNIIRILGPNELRYANLGEAIVLANNGRVIPDAITAFENALQINQNSTKSLFYLALEKSQSGKIDQAISSWKNLISIAQGDEPWIDIAKQQLATLDSDLVENNENQGFAPDLSNFNIDDIEDLDAETRNEMILGMVDGLEERLRTDGGTLEEWLQLINSQVVLGRTTEAQNAVTRALNAFSEDQNSIDRIRSVAESAKLEIQ